TVTFIPTDVSYEEASVICANQLENVDFFPNTQRIVRLTKSKSEKLSANESEVCCSNRFGGRLATPLEVYNASYSLGVDFCIEGWYLGWLAGNPCTGSNSPSEFWFYPTGNAIKLIDPMMKYFSFCYITLPNHRITSPDPFPPHRVMCVCGDFGPPKRYTLTYQEVVFRCIGYGGTLANRAQVENAQRLGYDCCSAGWVQSGEVIFPITHQRSNCPPTNDDPLKSWGYYDRS
ncbi:aggrecan core protein-like, partial [Anneissia japonica]|uniref:aggrecan core protein-like n=1 Tax=Anneissia japonica TaxID=1529436 RepID=UPI00142573F0